MMKKFFHWRELKPSLEFIEEDDAGGVGAGQPEDLRERALRLADLRGRGPTVTTRPLPLITIPPWKQNHQVVF